MKRNVFGDPRPTGTAEIVEALEEGPTSGDEVNALVEFSDGETEFDGWTAEVRMNDSGDEVFSTLGYDNKADLMADLRAAGITDIQSA